MTGLITRSFGVGLIGIIIIILISTHLAGQGGGGEGPQLGLLITVAAVFSGTHWVVMTSRPNSKPVLPALTRQVYKSQLNQIIINNNYNYHYNYIINYWWRRGIEGFEPG